MSIIEDIKKKAVSFHRKVDKFLDEKVKEATIQKTLFLIVLTIVLFTIRGIFQTYIWDVNLLALAIKNAPQAFLSVAEQWAILGTFVWFFLPVFAIWGFAKLAKKKTSLMKILYLYSVVLSIFAVVTTGLSVAGSLMGDNIVSIIIGPILGLFILAAIAYVGIMSLKKMIGPSTGDVVSGWLGSGLIIFAIIIGITVIGALAQQTSENEAHHYFQNTTIMNNSDGSFTIEHIETTSTEKYFTGVYCNMTFPKGWETNANESVIQNPKNNESFSYGLGGSPGNGGINMFGSMQDTYERGLEDSIQKATPYGFIVENASMSTNKEAGYKVVDIYLVSEDGTIAEHQASLGFVSFVHTEFHYDAPVGNDADYYYIVNNIRCSGTGLGGSG